MKVLYCQSGDEVEENVEEQAGNWGLRMGNQRPLNAIICHEKAAC